MTFIRCAPLCALLLAGCSSSSGGSKGTAAEDSISLSHLEGDWAGLLVETYLCETPAYSITLTIEDSTITIGSVEDNIFEEGASGTIAQSGDVDYIFPFFVDQTGTLVGALAANANVEYLLWVSSDGDEGANHGFIGALQRGAVEIPVFTEGDVLGDWAGVGAALGDDLGLVTAYDSEATLSGNGDGEPIEIDGEDDGGTFSTGGESDVAVTFLADEFQHFIGGTVTQGEDEYDMAMIPSFDAEVLGTVFMPNGCFSPANDVFDFVADMKFMLWERQ